MYVHPKSTGVCVHRLKFVLCFSTVAVSCSLSGNCPSASLSLTEHKFNQASPGKKHRVESVDLVFFLYGCTHPRENNFHLEPYEKGYPCLYITYILCVYVCNVCNVCTVM